MSKEKNMNDLNVNDLEGISGGIGKNFTGDQPKKQIPFSLYGICDSYECKEIPGQDPTVNILRFGHCCLNCKSNGVVKDTKGIKHRVCTL